jgi:hypothetical protein
MLETFGRINYFKNLKAKFFKKKLEIIFQLQFLLSIFLLLLLSLSNRFQILHICVKLETMHESNDRINNFEWKIFFVIKIFRK